MKDKLFLSFILIVSALFLMLYASTPAQAWLQAYEVTSNANYGFLYGLWHGIIAPFAVIAYFFDNDIVLYSSINNGFLYNIGFLLGISIIIGGGSKSAR